MNVNDLYCKAACGDVLLCKGTGFVSRLIRGFTGESVNHVAMLVHDGVWQVYEFVEGTGFNRMPLGKWMDKRKNQDIYFGTAPKEVSERPKQLNEEISRWLTKNSKSYGYLSLAKVWLAQWTGKRYGSKQKVCSTFVAEIWRAMGVEINKTVDPGDYFNICENVSHLKRFI